MRRVVVTGLGMVSAIGNDLESGWQAAVNATSGIKPIESFDSSRIPVKFAGEVRDFDPSTYMEPKDAKRSTRYIQFAMDASGQALKDSGLPVDNFAERVGCSIGVGIGGIDEIYRTSLILNEKGPRRVSPFFIPYVITNMAAGVAANRFNLKGPNICTSTACTSGTHAIGEAFTYIKAGLADAMVCGGAEAAICELSVAAFGNMKALTSDVEAGVKSSRPFDLRRSGFVMGEGAGVIVLEDYEMAKKRGAKIYAELSGYGMSGDAYHITSPAPEHEGALRCMNAALSSAEVNLDEVDYINAHGTSTKLNDEYETQAIRNCFGDHADSIWVSSTKGVTGHCLGAAGGIEAVLTAKAMNTGVIPPTAHLEEKDPACDLDYVPLEAREKRARVAMSNSFGFGGTNASIVFKKVE